MKYIIFKKKLMVHPIIFGEQLNHSDIKAGEGWAPVSAGFCYLDEDNPGHVKIPMNMGSESLQLQPRYGDSVVISLSLRNMTDATYYMDYGNTIYPEQK